MSKQKLEVGTSDTWGNLTLRFGEKPDCILLGLTEKRTLVKRLQWWLFCKVFPCTVDEFNP